MVSYIYCRMEKVNIRTKSGITKIVSVLLCLAGVVTLAFYKGPQLRTAHHILSGYHNHDVSPHHEDHFSSGKRWILGSSLLFLGVIIWSFWLIIQVASHLGCKIVPFQIIPGSIKIETFNCYLLVYQLSTFW